MRHEPGPVIPRRKRSTGKWRWAVGKVLFSVVLLAYLATKIDIASVEQDIRAADPTTLLLVLAQFAIIPLLGGVRWAIVLKVLGTDLPWRLLTRQFWIGMLFNQVLPSSSGGDVVRVWLSVRSRVPLARALHSVVLERVAVLFTLLVGVVMLEPHISSRLQLARFTWLPLLLVAMVAGLCVAAFADRIAGRLPPWRIVHLIAEFSRDVRTLSSSPRLVLLVAACLLTHANLIVASYFLGRALDLPLSFFDYVLFIPLITVIAVIPASIGGWGVREGATVLLLGAVGVSPHSALAFSILFGLLVVVVSLVGLPLLVMTRRDVEYARPAAVQPGTSHGS